MKPRAKHLKHKSYLVNSRIPSNLCNMTTPDQTVKSTVKLWTPLYLDRNPRYDQAVNKSICKINSEI